MKLLVAFLVVLSSTHVHAAGCEWGDARAVSEPLYGPEAPHPIAHECGASDSACVEAYDDRVFMLAVATTDSTVCAQSTMPPACREAYAMTLDVNIELPSIKACGWIYKLTGGQALLLMPLTGAVSWTLRRPGWKEHSYVGDCSTLPKSLTTPKVPR